MNTQRLTGLLFERGDLDGLRARIDAGDEHAAWRLAELLIEQGSERKRSGCAGSAGTWTGQLLVRKGAPGKYDGCLHAVELSEVTDHYF